MEKVEFTQEMYDKANDVVIKLAKVLDEERDPKYSFKFMVFVVARFSAVILRMIQEREYHEDVADFYTNLVKSMMETFEMDLDKFADKDQDDDSDEIIS